MHVIRIQPSKVSERPPTSVIRFYHPGGAMPINKHNQPPFVGEIFTHNGVPLRPKPQPVNIPERGNFENNNGISENKHTHFIFSDSTSLEDFQTKPFSSKVQTAGIFPTATSSISTANSISPNDKFEVFIEATIPERGEKISLTNSKSSSSTQGFENTFTKDNIKPTNVQDYTRTVDNETVPFGPITDWVPVFERPSMKFKPVSSNLNKTRADADVSIITHPIIFDITVRQSYNDQSISPNKTSEASTSTIFNAVNTRKSTESLLPIKITTSNTLTETQFEISSSKPVNIQNEYSSSFKSTPLLEESIVTITSIIEAKAPKPISTWYDTRTTFKEESSNLPKVSSKISSISKLTISSVETISASSRVEEETSLQKIYSPTLSSSSVSSKPFETSPTTSSNPNLGRPFVIPVDIEEVRPYVGAINPVDQEKPRGAYPPFRGTYPSGSVHVTRAEVNSREDPLPNNPF
ncbi:uncharacterized protein CEXT_411361 [Caerostris extrusa]|uniref:Uncharacterized protein n=1 Tax=Caerostris extrusa TaxID=172846 RepID=A0AAV4X9P4_CAEEX|nr:uncharacterized protein CEXT_411361 [Caerostris extrusa]